MPVPGDSGAGATTSTGTRAKSAGDIATAAGSGLSDSTGLAASGGDAAGSPDQPAEPAASVRPGQTGDARVSVRGVATVSGPGVASASTRGAAPPSESGERPASAAFVHGVLDPENLARAGVLRELVGAKEHARLDSFLSNPLPEALVDSLADSLAEPRLVMLGAATVEPEPAHPVEEPVWFDLDPAQAAARHRLRPPTFAMQWANTIVACARAAVWALPLAGVCLALAALSRTPAGGLGTGAEFGLACIALGLGLIGVAGVACLFAGTRSRWWGGIALCATVFGVVLSAAQLGSAPRASLTEGTAGWLALGGLALGGSALSWGILVARVLNKVDGVALMGGVGVGLLGAYVGWPVLLAVAAGLIFIGTVDLAWSATRLTSDIPVWARRGYRRRLAQHAASTPADTLAGTDSFTGEMASEMVRGGGVSSG